MCTSIGVYRKRSILIFFIKGNDSCCWQKNCRQQHYIWTVALTALCDVLLFWDELFYYESFGLFAVLILVQLVATGAAAFRFYYKQRKG